MEGLQVRAAHRYRQEIGGLEDFIIEQERLIGNMKY